MRNHKLALARFALLFFCTVAAAEHLPTFDEKPLAEFARKGTGTIIGKVSIRARSGDFALRPGSEVILTPVTPYTTSVHEALIAERRIAIDGRLAKYERKTRADADGTFVFHQVPAGDYYLRSLPRWQVRDENATISAASFAHGRVAVAEHQTTRAAVTR